MSILSKTLNVIVSCETYDQCWCAQIYLELAKRYLGKDEYHRLDRMLLDLKAETARKIQ